MTYFDFISKIKYNKAQLESQGIEHKEILVNDLDLTKSEDPMFSIWLYRSICG